MAYTVLARRYRSTDFDGVIGQEPIAKTLRAAIAHDRVAHAYLFCGTRGVGKTSMARIFAKALNNPADGERAPGDDGPPHDPEIDRAIMAGQDTDVIEIDGASNRRVEEARQLIGNAIYRPMRGRFKIYIIDEVHMLTTEAFNTLLKTMEEPPEHVKFILCTTEPQKVPATIRSRCQRFDFRNIPARRIGEHVAAVLEGESIGAEPELVATVARLGNGSMRDALSVLDRLIAAGQPTLTLALLEELLGLPDRELVGSLIDAASAGDVGGTLEAAGELLGRGVSGEQLLEVLAERYRDLLLLRACGADTELVELSDEARAAEAERAGRHDEAVLTHLIALAERVQRDLRQSAAPRALLDACVARMALTDKLLDAAAAAGGSPAGGASSGAAQAPRRRVPAGKA